MKIDIIKIINPKSYNFIFGQTHFIKTVEDIHEMVVTSVPAAKFGLAFCEASGPRLIRASGTDNQLIKLAVKNAQKVGCGHTFFIFLKDMYPINIMSALKHLPEVVNIFCATANSVEVIVVQTQLGRGVIGVIDGGTPLDVENKQQEKERKEFIRKIGYKL